MVLERRALFSAMLSLLLINFSSASEPPLNPWRNLSEEDDPAEPVFVTDLDYETDADLNLAQQAQFQSRAASGAGRTAAAQASLSRTGQRTPQSFNVRLARAPNMMGDFFGITSNDASIETFVGKAVHHTTSIDDIHLIAFTDSSQLEALYVGGSGGSVPGSFFVPGPSPPAPNRIEGLSSNIPGEFVAVKTSQLVDVFNAPNDTSPDISDAEVFNVFQVMNVDVPTAGPGDIVGRIRLQENNSAMPQDRVFFDYNYFHNVPLIANDLNIHRFAPGLEKTFFNGMMSVELRVPVGVSLNSDIISGGPFDTSNGEMGNMVVAPKVLLYANGESAFAIGCGVALPTADDININMVTGTRLLTIENESVHLLPYVAYLYSPSDSPLFAHAFIATDFDTNGNPVFADVTSGGIQELGRLNDQNLISAHFSLGSWIYQNRDGGTSLNGIAWTGEVHYTNTINDGDALSGATYTIGNPNGDLSLLNATIGGHARFGQTTLTLGYSTPLSDDKVFDGELRCFVNRNF
jgi:hypothetical protein